jgi:hypothetical protein
MEKIRVEVECISKKDFIELKELLLQRGFSYEVKNAE